MFFLHNNIVANVNDNVSYGNIEPIDGLSYKTSESDVFKLVGENYTSSYSRTCGDVQGGQDSPVSYVAPSGETVTDVNISNYVAYVYKHSDIYVSFFIGDNDYGLCGFEFALSDYYTPQT